MLYPPQVFVVSASLPPTLLLLVYNETSSLSLFLFSMPSHLFLGWSSKTSGFLVFLYSFISFIVFWSTPLFLLSHPFSPLVCVTTTFVYSVALCVSLCLYSSGGEGNNVAVPSVYVPCLPRLTSLFSLFSLPATSYWDLFSPHLTCHVTAGASLYFMRTFLYSMNMSVPRPSIATCQ